MDAKEEKIKKKLDFFNNIIVKKNKIKKYIQTNDTIEIKELFITKKGKR